jgi:hypothetical protein
MLRAQDRNLFHTYQHLVSAYDMSAYLAAIDDTPF